MVMLSVCGRYMVILQFVCLPFDSTSLAQESNTVQIQEANAAAFELRLQELLTLDVSESKETLNIAKKEHRELLTMHGSPRVDLAMAVLLFKAGKSSEASGYAKKAWVRSDQRMLSAAQILLRCQFEAKQYREALNLAKQLVELSQDAANAGERKTQMAGLVGSCVRLLEEIQTGSKSVDTFREKLDSEIRKLPDEEFLATYTATRNQLAAILQESDIELPVKGKEVEKLQKKMEALNGKDQAAEQAAAMVRATKEEKMLLLEKRLNALDATLAEADKNYKQLAPLIPQAEAYVDSLWSALNVTKGTSPAIVEGRTLAGPEIIQEFNKSSAKLKMLHANIANIASIGRAACSERLAISEQFRLLTGQAAAANADIEAWQTRTQEQKERLQKRVKLKQDPESLKQQISLAIPIDADDIMGQLLVP